MVENTFKLPEGHYHMCPRCSRRWREYKDDECHIQDGAYKMCEQCVWGKKKP